MTPTLRDRMPGLAVTIMVAGLAWLMVLLIGHLPAPLGELPLSMMLIAILAGLALAGTAARHDAWQPGLELARGPLLKFAVALIGLRLSLAELAGLGLKALPLVILIVAAGLILTIGLARLLKVGRRLSVLLAAGTSICGASAIAATAPGLNARSEETAYAIACIALFGLAATLLYPFILSELIGDPVAVGLIMGAAIHDTAQVTAAAALYEQAWDAEGSLVAATVTKLLRNATMLVVIPALVWMYRDQSTGSGRTALPLFILAFILLSGLRTGGDWLFGSEQAVWRGLIEASTSLSLFVFAMAMAALAMGIRPRMLGRLGWRPAAAAAISAIILLVLAAGWILAFHR